MVIRKEQMVVFESIAEQRFEDSTLEHLQKVLPLHCTLIGEDGTRQIVQLGWSRAKAYGLISERSVRLYIGLMLMLGSGFDKDPQLSWAAEILNGAQSPAVRQNMLYDAASNYIALVSGDQGEHVLQALSAARQMGLDGLPKSAARFSDQLIELLNGLYPAKCGNLGDSSLRRLIEQGGKAAKRHGIAGAQGVALYICLMFMLGSAFDDDPQFPWAAAAFKNRNLSDERAMVKQLHDSAMTHLADWLALPKEKDHVL